VGDFHPPFLFFNIFSGLIKRSEKMKVQVRRFGILQMGKLLALIYGLLAAIFLPFILIAAITSRGSAAEMLLIILIYPVGGFIGGIIGAALYNLASKLIGGIKIELDVEEVQS
jgi:hypothetical protein